MMRLRILAVAACGFVTFAAPAWAQGVDRRPCVAPGSPSNCDSSLRTGPTAPMEGVPVPEQAERHVLARVPIRPTPEGASPVKAPPSGEVSVKPVPPEGLDPSGAPGKGVGPTPKQ